MTHLSGAGRMTATGYAYFIAIVLKFVVDEVGEPIAA